MKIVQDSLKKTGIPSWSQIWQSTEECKTPPSQYYVYSYMLKPDEFQDDRHTSYAIYLYLQLWSYGDPTDAIETTRRVMFADGWAMEEETTKGYKQPAYDEMTDQYCVIWTWVRWEDA